MEMGWRRDREREKSGREKAKGGASRNKEDQGEKKKRKGKVMEKEETNKKQNQKSLCHHLSGKGLSNDNPPPC